MKRYAVKLSTGSTIHVDADGYLQGDQRVKFWTEKVEFFGELCD